jgi:hypothetical protein
MAAAYTLWVLAEPHRSDLLLVKEESDGALGASAYVSADADIHSFFAAHGMPGQISANVWGPVRRLRQTEARLFTVPAAVLKPKELVGPLVSIALRAHRL